MTGRLVCALALASLAGWGGVWSQRPGQTVGRGSRGRPHLGKALMERGTHLGEAGFYDGQVQLLHPKGARIVRNSHFAQIYKLGYKILLVCVARGNPRPQFKWFKDGAELDVKRNTHLYTRSIGRYVTKTKVEIDPATIGDQGIYTCLSSNPYDYDMKNFKTEYIYG